MSSAFRTLERVFRPKLITLGLERLALGGYESEMETPLRPRAGSVDRLRTVTQVGTIDEGAEFGREGRCRGPLAPILGLTISHPLEHLGARREATLFIVTHARERAGGRDRALPTGDLLPDLQLEILLPDAEAQFALA